jgi:hypothetical protein
VDPNPDPNMQKIMDPTGPYFLNPFGNNVDVDTKTEVVRVYTISAVSDITNLYVVGNVRNKIFHSTWISAILL